MASVGQVISSIGVSLDNFGPRHGCKDCFLMFFPLSSKTDFESFVVSKTMCFVVVILTNEHSATEGNESDPKNNTNALFDTP